MRVVLIPTVGPIDVRSFDSLSPWLPVLGPTATLLLWDLTRRATVDGTEVSMAKLAPSLGVKEAMLDKALARLDRFGTVMRSANDRALLVASHLAAPSERSLARAYGMEGAAS